MQSRPVDLRDRARRHWFPLEVLKDLVDGLAVHPLYRLFRTFQLVHGRTLPQHYELLRHVLADYVSAVAQVLEGLDPHESCALYAPKEDVEPAVPGPLPKAQGQQD